MTVSRSAELGAALTVVLDIERKWLNAVPQEAQERARNTSWMPFNPFRFITMAAEVLPEVAAIEQPRFLEMGAGPGTKMLLAREFFGWDVHGFDVCDEYAAFARDALALDVQTCDALEWMKYGGYDVIWFNRVYRDPELQERLEPSIWNEASPGTVLMCANLENRPPLAWYPVLDEWDDSRAGIWQKPSGA